jgi:hypothetical protein
LIEKHSPSSSQEGRAGIEDAHGKDGLADFTKALVGFQKVLVKRVRIAFQY